MGSKLPLHVNPFQIVCSLHHLCAIILRIYVDVRLRLDASPTQSHFKVYTSGGIEGCRSSVCMCGTC